MPSTTRRSFAQSPPTIAPISLGQFGVPLTIDLAALAAQTGGIPEIPEPPPIEEEPPATFLPTPIFDGDISDLFGFEDIPFGQNPRRASSLRSFNPFVNPLTAQPVTFLPISSQSPLAFDPVSGNKFTPILPGGIPLGGINLLGRR